MSQAEGPVIPIGLKIFAPPEDLEKIKSDIYAGLQELQSAIQPVSVPIAVEQTSLMSGRQEIESIMGAPIRVPIVADPSPDLVLAGANANGTWDDSAYARYWEQKNLGRIASETDANTGAYQALMAESAGVGAAAASANAEQARYNSYWAAKAAEQGEISAAANSQAYQQLVAESAAASPAALSAALRGMEAANPSARRMNPDDAALLANRSARQEALATSRAVRSENAAASLTEDAATSTEEEAQAAADFSMTERAEVLASIPLSAGEAAYGNAGSMMKGIAPAAAEAGAGLGIYGRMGMIGMGLRGTMEAYRAYSAQDAANQAAAEDAIKESQLRAGQERLRVDMDEMHKLNAGMEGGVYSPVFGGAGIGGMAGSFIPGLGTGVGMAAGAVAGGAYSAYEMIEGRGQREANLERMSVLQRQIQVDKDIVEQAEVEKEQREHANSLRRQQLEAQEQAVKARAGYESYIQGVEDQASALQGLYSSSARGAVTSPQTAAGQAGARLAAQMEGEIATGYYTPDSQMAADMRRQIQSVSEAAFTREQSRETAAQIAQETSLSTEEMSSALAAEDRQRAAMGDITFSTRQDIASNEARGMTGADRERANEAISISGVFSRFSDLLNSPAFKGNTEQQNQPILAMRDALIRSIKDAADKIINGMKTANAYINNND